MLRIRNALRKIDYVHVAFPRFLLKQIDRTLFAIGRLKQDFLPAADVIDLH